MKTGMNCSRIFIPIAMIIICLLVSLVPFVYGQPQGYTLLYSSSRVYGVDWMNVKAVYVKAEGGKLCFYVEYYGPIPSSHDYHRDMVIFMDFDKNSQTGQQLELDDSTFGADCYLFFELYGDGDSHGSLFWWTQGWQWVRNLESEITRGVGLSFMEIRVDQQAVGYTPYGIRFYVETFSGVKAMPETELSYVIDSSKKNIVVDGEPDDWGTIAPLKTFPSREINPSELEVSSIYVANDDENLYFRFGTRGKPTITVGTGVLDRHFYIYFDTDNNDNTGFKAIPGRGAEFHCYAEFGAGQTKYTYVGCSKYIGAGSDWEWEVIPKPRGFGNFNSIFELKIPLNILNVGVGQTVGIDVDLEAFFCYRTPVLTYPDRTPPVTAIVCDPSYRVGSRTYVSGSTIFTLSASDENRVKETKYRVDGGAWNTYTAGFNLSALPDGTHMISYYSVDNVGNEEDEKTLTIVLDKTSPVVSEASPTGSMRATSTPSSVTFTVRVEDSGSGVKEVKLIVDGISQGTMSPGGNTYSRTVSLSEGSHTWSIEVVDNVGNIAIQYYSLSITKSLPLETYLATIAIIVTAIAIVTIIMRRRRTQPPPPPPP